jgi:hypothetical protein
MNKQVKAYPFTGLDRPLDLDEVEAPRISRQSAHDDGPTHRPSLLPRRYSLVLTSVRG